MKKKLILLMALLTLTTTIAEDPMTLTLKQGENIIQVNEYFTSYPVSYLINQYPSIQSVSMQEYGQTFGYINAFGGIGIDFLIQPGKEYEIYVGEDTSINLVS